MKRRRRPPVWMKDNIQQKLSEIFELAYDERTCNFTRQELANASGLHYSTIYGLETQIYRVPSYGTMLKLIRAIKMDTSLALEELAAKPRRLKVSR